MNNKLGSEALFQASSACKLRLVRMLIEGGTSANVRNERLETPLMLCCQSRADAEEKQKVANYLLTKKAKVNLQDVDGRTALIHASLSNSGKEIIQALLDAKASPWLQDESKNTVFDYVINAGDLETTRLLINACRDNMMADDRDMDRMKYLEEYLANVQDMRKVSWPLMGPRALTNHMKVYVAKKDETAPSLNNRLGCDLAAENSRNSPQPERRRKRSVCLFDPLDLQEVLNSDEVTTEAAIPKNETSDDDKGERRKTSVRSLSEEERFSFQISDGENTAEENLPELEKLLRLQDSFSSSIDSNDSHSTTYEPADFDRCEYAHEQVYQETNSLENNKGFMASKEEKGKYEDETCARSPGYERKQELSIRNKSLTHRERQFRFSLGSREIYDSCTLHSERSKKPEGNGVDKATVDCSKVGLDTLDKEGNQPSSYETHRHSSPVSLVLSPRVNGSQTIKARTLKQSSSPRVSPVTVLTGQNRRDASLVRRYTLSEMDMGKLPSAEVVPQVRSTSVEPLEQTRSAVSESTNQVGSEGTTTPPGLRKSKSDMSDWISMSEYFQETEIVELTRVNCQNTHQNTVHLKFDGNEIGQAQLPSISPTRKVRPSPKDWVHAGSGVISPTKSKQANVENRSEFANFLSKSSIRNEKCSKGQSRINLSTDPSIGSLVFSDKSHTSTLPSMEDPDKEQEDTLPDLLLSCLPQDGHSLRHGSISPPNSSSITSRDITTSNSKTPEEQTAGSSQGQQRLSPRLRPGTLLPPLLITNRRTPTHEMEDGYFSGSPSPADVESPRKKHSHEHLSYSFKPISPRSPIPSQKVFALQTGKPPSTPR